MFDLDDTLYKEEDFLFSGYNAIAGIISDRFPLNLRGFIAVQMKQWRLAKKDVFDELCRRFPDHITKDECLNIYRNHFPSITLSDGAYEVLTSFKEKGIRMGIVSDGRERTQMNKIRALGLLQYIEGDDIVISESFGSEKPDERNYRYFMKRYPDCEYVYVADNVKKDFITPNRLGWKTICLLDDGRNIHKQDFSLNEEYLPQMQVRHLSQVESFLYSE